MNPEARRRLLADWMGHKAPHRALTLREVWSRSGLYPEARATSGFPDRALTDLLALLAAGSVQLMSISSVRWAAA